MGEVGVWNLSVAGSDSIDHALSSGVRSKCPFLNFWCSVVSRQYGMEVTLIVEASNISSRTNSLKAGSERQKVKRAQPEWVFLSQLGMGIQFILLPTGRHLSTLYSFKLESAAPIGNSCCLPLCEFSWDHNKLIYYVL